MKLIGTKNISNPTKLTKEQKNKSYKSQIKLTIMLVTSKIKLILQPNIVCENDFGSVNCLK